MKKHIYFMKRRRVHKRFSPFIFWKSRRAGWTVLCLYSFSVLCVQNVFSKSQEPVMEFKVERTASETPYTNLENRSSDIQLPEVRELTLKQKTDTSQGLQKQTRVNTFLAKMALFFQSNGKRGESVNSYINGLTQFYKLAGLYRIMTAAERKAIKDLVSADKYASPVINYLDAFASLNQDAFLRVLAEMFAQDNPKLIGKTMKSEDVERMLQVVRLGEDNMNTSSDFERSLCTDPGLSATST